MLRACLQGQVNTQAVEIKLVGAIPKLAPTHVALCQPDGTGRIQDEDTPGEDPERAGESLGKGEGGIRRGTKKMRGISTPQGWSCNLVKFHLERSGNEKAIEGDGDWMASCPSWNGAGRGTVTSL